MGSGKSTLAPLVANVLGYSNVDIDHEIEHQIGMTIAEYFKIHGEANFRILEHSVLKELCRREHHVIALGGGTVAFGENLDIIKSTGVLVYLKTDEATILKRVQRKQHRPMLYDKNGVMLSEEALKERIHLLFLSREPYYSKADVTVQVGDSNVAYTVDHIVSSIRRHGDAEI